MNIFSQLTAGDSASWTDSPFTDTQGVGYDALTWALSYEIRGAVSLTLNGVASGNGWTTAITTAQSLALTPGRYSWAAYATKSGARVTAGSGVFNILTNMASVSGAYETRTQNELDLDAVRAEIRSRVSGGMTLEYMIGNRSLKKEPTSVLLEIESRLVRMVRGDRAAESIANGLGDPRKIGVRFGSKK